MLGFSIFTVILLVPFLSFSVRAFPLSQRDVITPPITKPDASSVWPVGTQQLVTWDTSGIPPPSQVTNPTAQIILGYNESNSLNLDFNNPLASNFLLTDGNVTITVPNVPPRDDYLIVLFGDSGDTSPTFAITSISPPSNMPSSSGSTSSSSIVPTTSLSFSAYVMPSASTSSTSSGADTTTASPPTGTTTTPTTGATSSSSSTSNSGSGVTSALAALSSATSSGWSLHGSNVWRCTASKLLMSAVPLVMAFMI